MARISYRQSSINISYKQALIGIGLASAFLISDMMGRADSYVENQMYDHTL